MLVKHRLTHYRGLDGLAGGGVQDAGAEGGEAAGVAVCPDILH